MDTIADFVSKDDQILRLNTQVNMMARFYTDFYEDQIKQLKIKLTAKSKSATEYKAKWRAETSQHETPTDKARRLIRLCKSQPLGESISSVCVVIAKESELSVGGVRNLWYEKL